MHIRTKRLLALLLCGAVLFSCLAPAFAAETETEGASPTADITPEDAELSQEQDNETEQPEKPDIPHEAETGEASAKPEESMEKQEETSQKPQPEASTEEEAQPEPTVEEAPADEPEEEVEETPDEEQPPIPMRKAPLLAASKSSPWTFSNSGWGDIWYIYSPEGSMYSKFYAERGDETRVAYCLNRNLSSPNSSVDYETGTFPTSKHYQVGKIICALGYPSNSLARIEEMFGYDLTSTQAQQATQAAIGAAQKSLAEDWTVNETYNRYVVARDDYDEVYDYSKALCTRGMELLNNPKTAAKYTVTPTVTDSTTSKVAVSIVPYRAYGIYKITIKNLPSGTLLTTGQNTRWVEDDGTLNTAKNKAVSGTIVLRGMAGTSGSAEGRFTLSSIPRGNADRTISISMKSYSKLAATDEVEWGQAPDDDYQNMLVAGMSEGAQISAQATAKIAAAPPEPHHFSVKKVAMVNGEQWSVSGITFTLMRQNGSKWEKVGNLVEQSTGTYQIPEKNNQWTFSMTEGGTYKVIETSATKEVLNSGWESPTFVWKKFTALNLSYTAKDAIPTGYIGILKQDSEKNTPIQGVGFEVTAAEDVAAKVGNRSTVIYEQGEAITEGETNAEGKMVVKELPYGKYTVTETKHPEGYAAENVSFTVTVGAPSDYSASKVYTNPMIGYATYPAGMAVTTANGLRYVTVGNTPIHPDMAVSKLTERTTNRDGKAVAFDANTGRYTEGKVSGTYYNNQNAKFTVTVTNTGDVDLYDLQVKDVMSDSLWSVVNKDGTPIRWREVNDTPLALGKELVTGSQVSTAKGGKATVTKVSYDMEKRTFSISFDRLAVGDSFRIQISCSILNSSNVNRNNLPNDVYLYSYHKTNGTTGTVTKTPGGGEGDCHDVDALNVVSQGNVTIHKQDAKGQPLAGVHFELTDTSGHPVSFVLMDSDEYAATFKADNGDWIPAAESGKPTTTDLVTDADGNLKLTQLPEGSYTLTETKTIAGQTLLTKPVEITLPLVQSGEESDQPGNVYFDNANHFYDLTYTITNGAQYQLPATGGHGTLASVLFGVLMLSALAWMLTKNHHKGDSSHETNDRCPALPAVAGNDVRPVFGRRTAHH